MENGNVLLKIEAAYQSLRPSEQKVADYVIKNHNEVIYYTVDELSSYSGVSNASVMRFVKGLGFKGFQHFKLALASHNEQESDVDRVEEDDNAGGIKNNMKANIIKSLNDTGSILDDENLEKATDNILAAKNIFIIGVGSSGAIARLLEYNLLRMGIVSKYINDSHLQAMHASLSGKEQLVIGISHSGSTKDSVDVMKIAHRVGAKTICITDHIKSPIVEYSDILLCTYAKEDPLGISMGKSAISQVFVIEVLSSCIYARIKERAKEARKKTAESVLPKIY